MKEKNLSLLLRDNKKVSAKEIAARLKTSRAVIVAPEGAGQVIQQELFPASGTAFEVVPGGDQGVMGLSPENWIPFAEEQCRTALLLHPETQFAVAAEGFVQRHPQNPLINLHTEVVVLLSRETGLLIHGSASSAQDTFRTCEPGSDEEVIRFLQEAGYPATGVVVRAGEVRHEIEFSGFRTADEVLDAFRRLRLVSATVRMETDPSPAGNPARIHLIRKATQQLMKKIHSACPQCDMPGYTESGYERGLPCNDCGSATHRIRSVAWSCGHCGHHDIQPFPNGHTAHSSDCIFCNP